MFYRDMDRPLESYGDAYGVRTNPVCCIPCGSVSLFPSRFSNRRCCWSFFGILSIFSTSFLALLSFMVHDQFTFNLFTILSLHSFI